MLIPAFDGQKLPGLDFGVMTLERRAMTANISAFTLRESAPDANAPSSASFITAAAGRPAKVVTTDADAILHRAGIQGFRQLCKMPSRVRARMSGSTRPTRNPMGLLAKRSKKRSGGHAINTVTRVWKQPKATRNAISLTASDE